MCVYVHRLGGVELEDVRLPRDEINKMRESGALPKGHQIPVAFLSYIDEKHVVHETVVSQSVNIMRACGKLSTKKVGKRGIPGIIARVASGGVTATPTDMYPDSIFLAAKVDEMIAFVDDSFETLVVTVFPTKYGINDHRNRKHQIKHRKQLAKVSLPNTLGAIEGILPSSLKGVSTAPATEEDEEPAKSSSSSSSWLVSCVGMNGSAVDDEEDVWACGTEMLTIADVYLCCYLNILTSGFFGGIPTDIIDEFPGLTSLQRKFNGLPEVKAYYADIESKGQNNAFTL